ALLQESASPLTIFGNDHLTPDGTTIRDYVHVTDLARAHIQAVDYLLKGEKSIKLNLRTGQGYSVRQIIEAVTAFTGRPLSYEILPRFAYESPTLVADSRLAREVLNWAPHHSDLSNIIATAWKWHTSQEATPKELSICP